MSDETLEVGDLPWASTPVLMAGTYFYVDQTGLLERLYWKARGISRSTYEIGMRTANGNKYTFVGGEGREEVDTYMDLLGEMTPGLFAEHMRQLAEADKEFGYDHKVSDLLMVQWREICHAWTSGFEGITQGVVPGDFVATIDPEEVETVEGRIIIPPGTTFVVREVMFDQDRSVQTLTTRGDVIHIPWKNYRLISKRMGPEGRESGMKYVYVRDRGYVPAGKASNGR